VKTLAAAYGGECPTLGAFVDKIGPDPVPRRSPSASGGGRRQAAAAPRRASGGQRTAGRSSGADPIMKDAIKSYEAGDYDGAVAKLDARRATKGETRDLSVLRGWALHNSGQHKKPTRSSVSWRDRSPPRKPERAPCIHGVA
jgi:hypothetical protein